jgi:hypothetical protein
LRKLLHHDRFFATRRKASLELTCLPFAEYPGAGGCKLNAVKHLAQPVKPNPPQSTKFTTVRC